MAETFDADMDAIADREGEKLALMTDAQIYSRYGNRGMSVLPVIKKHRRKRCEFCDRTDPHIHCPECGSTKHAAANCDNLG